MSHENYETLLRKIVGGLILLGFIALIFFSPSIKALLIKAVKPLAIAFAIAYLVDPIVRFLVKKFNLKRKLAIGMTIILLIVALFISGSLIIPNLVDSFSSMNNLLSSATSSPEGGMKFMKDVLGIEMTNEMMIDFQNSIESAMTEISRYLTQALQGILSSVMTFTSSIVSFFLSFIIAIYMLLDKEDLLRRINRMVKAYTSPERYAYLTHVSSTTNSVFSSFFVGKIIDSAIIGVLCGLIMILFKIPNATTFGFIVGLTNMIPYFGPIIGAVPCVIITLIISPMKSLWVLLIIVVLQQFDGLILGPKILGDKLGVGAFWIITAVTVGGALWGVLGMLIGVPVVIIFKNLIEESVEKRLSAK